MILNEIREVIYETDQPEEKENLNNQEIIDLNRAILKALMLSRFDDAEKLVAPYVDDTVILNRLGQVMMKKYDERKNWGTVLKKLVGISKLKSGKYPGLLALYKANV